ncbi:prepilin-type N-terminal cleavage/methylation domain-containing protein [bacterium]|nr:prepilin-type N-terminal cleavage/methylation domain-containing protein [bacterium]
MKTFFSFPTSNGIVRAGRARAFTLIELLILILILTVCAAILMPNMFL